jgi:hypothetical protein
VNKRRTSAFAAAGLAGLAIPVAMGTNALGQGTQTVVTQCPSGVTAPSPYCSVTTVGTTGTTTTATNGNTGTQTTPTTTTPGSSNSSRANPRAFEVASSRARFKRKPAALTLRGKLTPAPGTSCSGDLVAVVSHKNKVVGRKTGTLPSSCAFTLKAKIDQRKVKGRSGTFTVVTRYLGNSGMTPAKAKTVRVRYGK